MLLKKNNKNIFIGDAAYDSNNIRNKLKDLNLEILVVLFQYRFYIKFNFMTNK